MSDPTDNPSPVLEARNLVKSFPYGEDRITVLKEASLTALPGRSLSIRGESGCGKTTLLNVLSRLETADSGELLLDGASHDPSRSPNQQDALWRAEWLGVVYQSYYLIPELNALENVLMAARLAGRLTSKMKERARALMERMGVSGRERQPAHRLSGGERQRVAIARALLTEPSLILADEPTGNLDEATATEVTSLLFETCADENAALILVTHNPEFADAADQSLLLTEGVLSPA